jgi:hypothetical protein
MRRKVHLVPSVLMAAGLAFSIAATAQSNTDVQRALVKLDFGMKQLNAELGNFQQMQRARPGNTPDSYRMSLVAAAIDSFEGTESEFYTTAGILLNMKSPDDAQYVRGMLRVVASGAVQEANNNVDALSIQLISLGSPSAVNEVTKEVTKMRDLILEMRDAIHSVLPITDAR